MKSTSPPALATWLLRCLASGPNRESLAGDLIERFRNGRSRAWYSRQVIIAVFVWVIRDVRHPKLLTVRAVLTCWTLMWIL
jgi:hypothetical protein